MFAQFHRLHRAQRDATPVNHARMVCVRTGAFSTAQGSLVWERNGIACVQVFSQQVVGERI